MILRIEIIEEKKLIGVSCEMTKADNKTQSLWGKFMPRYKEIQNNIGSELFAMQVYHSPLFRDFTPETSFKQCACILVSDFDAVPENMETFVIPTGLYAVFVHKGLPSDFPKTMAYIAGEWFPQSEYTWDFRPHFQVMGDKYKNNDPSSEEEVWVPIVKKH